MFPCRLPSVFRSLACLGLAVSLSAPLRADPSEVNADRLPLKTERAANVFTLTDTVVFHLDAPAAQDYGWRVRDWQGNVVNEGVLPAGARHLEIEDVEPGYFELEVKGEREVRWQKPVPFATVIPPERRSFNPDSPFAVDSAQSWLAAKGHRGNKLDPENPLEVISDLTRLAGVPMIRDRMNWSDRTHPAPDRFDWEPFDANATALAQRGIQVYSLYESFKNRPAPAWSEGGILDLAAIHAFSEAAARNFSGRTSVWEFWNEPDLKRDIPVWDFVAAQKAAWLGFKRGDPGVRVLNGSLSNIHRFAGVLDGMFENGLSAYHDIFNLHTYLVPKHHHRVIDATFATLAKHGEDKRAIWVTEVGLAYEGNGELPPLQEGSPNREHGAEQARAQAERVVTAEVTLHALGAERVFFFVLPPFNEAEGRKAWGLLRWDWLVKPGYVSLANLTAQLGDARVLGAYDVADGVTGWLFEQLGTAPNEARRGTQTLVLWAGVNQTVRHAFPPQQEPLEFVDLMGKTSALKPRTSGPAAGQYAFKVGTSPVYVNGLRGLVPTRPAPRREVAPLVLPTPAEVRDERSTVLRVRLGEEFKNVTQLYAPFPAKDTVSLTVDVFNFSETAIRGALKNLGGGYELLDAPSEVVVPPMGRGAVSVRVRFDATARNAAQATVLRLGGDFAGRVVAPVAIPVLPDFDALLNRGQSRPVREAHEVARWSENSSGVLEITTDANTRTTTFSVKFRPGADRWVHPYLALDSGAFSGALGMSFQVKAKAGAKAGRGMLVLSDATTPAELVYGEQPDIPFEITENWTTVKLDFRANPMFLRPEQIRLLRVGTNPAETDYEFSIRDMRIHF